MKLFDSFSVIKSNDENRMLIVNGLFISYIYFIDLDIWKKYAPYKYMHYSCHELNTIMDITKYKEVTKEEFFEATKGVFPRREEDIIRLCDTDTLSKIDLYRLLDDDYREYMHDDVLDSNSKTLQEQLDCIKEHNGYIICENVKTLLSQSYYPEQTFSIYHKLRDIFDEAYLNNYDCPKTNKMIKELELKTFNHYLHNDLLINDNENSRSGMLIVPGKVVYDENANQIVGHYSMDFYNISFDETPFNYSGDYVLPFFDKNYDKNLDIIQRGGECPFCRLYALDTLPIIINDIINTINDLKNNIETDYTNKILKIDSSIDKRIIIDFYNRFIYRLEFLYKISKEKSLNLIELVTP